MHVLKKNSSALAIFIFIFLAVYIPQWIWTIRESTHQVEKGIKEELVFPIAGDDSFEYTTLAKNILTNGVYSLSSTSPFLPETMRTPGYPFFIAGIYKIAGTLFAVTFVQSLLVVSIAFLIYKIIDSITQKKKLAIILGVVFMLSPTTMSLALTLWADILFTFLLLLAFYVLFFLQFNLYKKIATVGVIVGLLILVKPVATYFLVLFPLFLFFSYYKEFPWRKMLAVLGLFLFIASVTIAPWIIRNKIQTGHAAVSSITAWGLYWVFIPQYIMWSDNPNYRDTDSYKAVYSNYENTHKLSSLDARKLENSSKALEIATSYIRQDPLGYTQFHIYQSKDFFIGSSLFYASNFYRYWPEGHWLVRSEKIVWLIVWLIGLLGIWSQRRNKVILAAGILILYLWLLTGPGGVPRLRIHAEPFLFILSSLGIVYSVHIVRNRILKFQKK